MYCNRCGKTLAEADRYCAACGNIVPAGREPISIQPSHQPQGAGKVLGAIASVVLMVFAFATFNPLTATLAIPLIIVGAFVMSSKIGGQTKLIAAAAIVVILIISDRVEDWQVSREKEKVARADKESKERQLLEDSKKKAEFDALTPGQHLAEAAEMLDPSKPQPVIQAGLKHLDAIPVGSENAPKAQSLRFQYWVRQKKHDLELNRQRVEDAKAKATVQATLNRVLRDDLAKRMEIKMLDDGYNMEVRATGTDHTTLRWIQENRTDRWL
jgi:hypothetical protein